MSMEDNRVLFSVIMPTYNQCTFIRRAIASLFEQTYPGWELIIVNDGSTDRTKEYLADYLSDERVTYVDYSSNQGLGYAVNRALELAKYEYIAYLPSDDFYYKDHLQILKEEFEREEEVVLVYTKAASQMVDSMLNYRNYIERGLCVGHGLQLVQTAHRKTQDRWVERNEYIDQDLFHSFWYKLTNKGDFRYIDRETCAWTIHSCQRHDLINDTYGGGLNIYRSYYQVKAPLKIRVSPTIFIDEEDVYRAFRKKHAVAQNALKILIVGELAYNPERIYALEEAGHLLYGLWLPKPDVSFLTVGPLPFGHVTDVPYANWEETVRQIQPDVIYGLLNHQAINWVHQVATTFPEIPLVWHFKEGPMVARTRREWENLIELFQRADGMIYIDPEVKTWYEQFLMPTSGLSMTMDGDLPKADYFTNDFSRRLSADDGEIHTVAPGRLVGVSPNELTVLARRKVHVHLYVENFLERRKGFIEEAYRAAPGYFHLHPRCAPKDWVREFSKYDAGWLHCFRSMNGGEIGKASWDDLNLPARLNTLAAAGLPMIQRDNSGHIVAMQACIRQRDMGVFFQTYDDLADQLYDTARLEQLRRNVLEHRMDFAFDTYMDKLVELFRTVVARKKQKGGRK